MTKAYSYIRFSTSEQESGDSLRRQKSLALKFINDNPDLNLELDESLNLFDKGVSAYKGKNALDGKLSVFLKAIESGQIERGSYLLVENHDRLSRDKVTEALHRFTSILRAGINIVTLSDSKVYSNDNLNEIDLIISLIVMSRAHSESEMKSKRIKAAWDNKKKNARTQKMTKACAKWLKLSDDRSHYVVIEERAKVIKQIFNWSNDGLGIHAIIRKLDELNIKPFETERTAKRWHSAIIQRFLTDRKVLGEFTVQIDDKDEVIKDYFPRIIDDETFYKSLNARESRKIKGGGRKGKYLTNLFSRIVKCGYSLDDNYSGYRCAGNNESMIYVNKNKNNQTHLNYLQCNKVRDGNKGCDSCRKLYNYEQFEKSFLKHVTEIDSSLLFKKKESNEIDILKNSLLVEEAKLIEIQASIKKISESIETYTEIPKFLIERGLKLESEYDEKLKIVESIKSQLNILELSKQNETDKSDELYSIIKLLDECDESELFDLRVKLSTLIKSIVESIEVYSNGLIMTQEKINSITKNMNDIDRTRFIKNLENEKVLQFYIVNYKSGEIRIVHDKSDFLENVKIKNNKIISIHR